MRPKACATWKSVEVENQERECMRLRGNKERVFAVTVTRRAQAPANLNSASFLPF